jgi:H+/Cl- antiporter ClcA
MKHQRGDFSRDTRTFYLSAIAIFIGIAAAFSAKGLLLLIGLFNNVFYYGEFSFLSRPPSFERWGALAIFIPAIGGLIIGLMARYGSEKIRGHGIPEALEAILFGKSIMQPKVAVLKPLSSAISIG